MNDTIAAISTPAGKGGIAVIRVSGYDAVAIADRVFRGGKKLALCDTHTIHYGFIVNEKGEQLDEVLVSLMRAPRTFTREDTVEISTHGGTASPNTVLDALIRAGARMAEAGEFTKRAFLNGRIDLAQAEAVIDIINAENDLAKRNALSQLGGALSREIREARGGLVHLAARLQVVIDYPDEDLEDITPAQIRATADDCRKKLDRLLELSSGGKIIRDGIRTAIVGKPNVGKSSLLNSLAREERAIVTDIAGTTRDIIEERVSFYGIPLVLTDTAGIRDTEDAVEKIGVERSRSSIEAADLVIVMIDGGSFDDEDLEVLRATHDKKRIVLINKKDLGQSKYAEEVKARAADSKVIEVSAKTGYGLEALKEEIKRLYNLGAIMQSSGAVVTNMRHKAALISASDALVRVCDTIDSGLPTDFASIDINAAIDALGTLTGETVSEAVVNDIFHQFCVGK